MHGKHDGETSEVPFHGKLDGETHSVLPTRMEIDPRSAGFLLGILVGEGHFGGDGRQPHVTLRMHTRYEALFHWLVRTIPGGRLYGPYTHGGRSYYQWMIRGAALRDELVPLVRTNADLLDPHTASRFDEMCARYGIA